MKTIFSALALACLLSLNAGCILGPIAASNMSEDQIKALKEYNDNGDVYFCGIAGGPPPAGSIVAIAVPKGAPVDVTFGPDCHATVKTRSK